MSLMIRSALALPKNLLWFCLFLLLGVSVHRLLLVPALLLLVPILLGVIGFIFSAPLPTPIARATGADRRRKR
jgi:hypothetical protein